MIERPDINQYNVAFDSQRFIPLMAQRGKPGFEEKLAREIAYTERQLKTDIGERLDAAESHFVYEIRGEKLYGIGESGPFEDAIERGVVEKFDGTRENADLVGFKFIQQIMSDPATADGTIIFNPSPPDGKNCKKNYLDVHRKVGNEVHSVRYLSTLSNVAYRQKILEINPNYSEVIPPNPTDIDFLLNPVVVPRHLNFSPDGLAMFVLEKKKGMPKDELDRIWMEIVPSRLSLINTLVENPDALGLIEEKYVKTQVDAWEKAGRANFASNSGGEMVIVYVDNKPAMIGGGGCGSGSCSTSISSSSDVPSSPLDNLDGRGNIHFRCDECGTINKRELFQYVYNCKKCGSDKVLPPGLRNKFFQPGLKMKQ